MSPNFFASGHFYRTFGEFGLFIKLQSPVIERQKKILASKVEFILEVKPAASLPDCMDATNKLFQF